MRYCATASRIGLMRNSFLHPVQKYHLHEPITFNIRPVATGNHLGKALWNSSQNYACFHVSLVDHALVWRCQFLH